MNEKTLILELWTEQELLKIGGVETNFVFTVKDTITTILPDAESALGYTIGQIRERNKILDKLETATDSVELTKPQVELLFAKLNSIPFIVASKSVLRLADTFENFLNEK